MSTSQPLEDLRLRLDEIAADIPNRTAIEERVEFLTRQPRRRGWYPFAAVAAVVAVMASVVFFAGISGSNSESVAVVVGVSDEPLDSFQQATAVRVIFTSTSFSEPIHLEIADHSEEEWAVIAESEHEIDLLIPGSDAAADDGVIVRLITIPNAEADNVVDELLAGLFDTDVIASRSAPIGPESGTEVELASRRGTSHAAFRLGPNTYVETIGVDRRYLVRVIDRPQGAFVLWMDAHDEDFATARTEIELLAASLVFR